MNNADVTHIFKDKGKLNGIIKGHSVAYVTFVFLWNVVRFCKFYVWGKNIFTVYLLYIVSPITIGDLWNHRKKTSENKFDYHKNGGNEEIAECP